MRLKNTDGEMRELAWMINSRYGVDLSLYRSSCIQRRVMHRLSMVGCRDMEEYFAFLEERPGELDKLMDILTIHVTGFFRDTDVFETLEKSVLPDLLEEKAAAEHKVVRIWSAGCSTGEEAYSLAILLDHLRRKARSSVAIEVFGTDVSEEACKVARSGLYPEERVGEVPSMLRNGAFTPHGEMFRISGDIRKIVKFRPHNLFSPPPYSMVDLISCRNVLIHFGHDVRGRINRYFHSSLCEEGMLVLGKSEALGEESLSGFEIVYPRCKIYRKTKGDNTKEER